MPLRGSAPPRVTRKFVRIVAVCWRETLPTLPLLMSPQRPLQATRPDRGPEGGRGRGLSGWPESALFNPPSPSSIGANRGRVNRPTLGHRILPTLRNPERASSLPLPQFPHLEQTRALQRRQAPPHVSEPPRVQTLSSLALRLGTFEPRQVGRPVRIPGSLLLSASGAPAAVPSARPLYLCPVAGPVPPPC